MPPNKETKEKMTIFPLKMEGVEHRSSIQGQQGLSGHFEMALTGRKKVAKSKLMVASNSQQRHIFRHMVSFYVPIKSWPQ